MSRSYRPLQPKIAFAVNPAAENQRTRPETLIAAAQEVSYEISINISTELGKALSTGINPKNAKYLIEILKIAFEDPNFTLSPTP